MAKLISENERVYQRINGVVAFLCDNPLRPVSNIAARSAFIGTWYRDHSKIFVDKDHDIWSRITDGKKLSKRYGKLIRSEETMLNSMMQRHLSEVWEFMKATGDFEDMDLSEEEAEDAGDEMAGPQRSAFSSPPQSRPVTGVSTAQSSAALRGVMSSTETSPKGAQPPMSPRQSAGPPVTSPRQTGLPTSPRQASMQQPSYSPPRREFPEPPRS